MLSVKIFRMKKGLTQLQLAARSGITNQYLCKIESGKVDPRRSTLEKIAAALNTTAEELLAYEKTIRGE